MKTIKVQNLTPDNFKDFGKVISVTAKAKPDADTEIQTFFGQLAIMKSSESIEFGICVAKNREYVVETLEQHIETEELLAALKGDFITPVALSVETGGKLVPDMDNMIAVRVNQGEGVVFGEGVWHWTPYAVTETCDVLVAFKTDTPKNDFISYSLDENIRIEL